MSRHALPALVAAALAAALAAGCASPSTPGDAPADFRQFTFPEAEAIGEVPDLAGEPHPIRQGGHSGLAFVARRGDVLEFVTHPDRGPNGEPTDLLPDVPGDERPFPAPDFPPGLIHFTLNLASGEARVIQEWALLGPDGVISGRPNLQAGAPQTPHTDEVGVDLEGRRLENDPLGADLEGVELDPRDGSFWLCDEYRPSIYHVAAGEGEGCRLIDRFVPLGTAAAAGLEADGSPFGRELLPALYAERRQNRGFEGITIRTLDDGTVLLYAFLQSPLVKGSEVSRVLELDITDARRPQVVGEYLYPMEEAHLKVEKIGDAGWLGGSRLAVVEQNSELGGEARRYVTEVDLAGATNLLNAAIVLPAGTRIEDHDLEALAALGIAPLAKRRLFDLIALKFEADKVEGLTVIRPAAPGEATLIVIVNDDDFGLLDEPVPGDGRQPFLPALPPSRVGVLTLD